MNSPFAKRLTLPLWGALPPSPAEPGSLLARADEATAALLLLIEQLPPQERTAYLLGGLLDMDDQALARLMDWTPSDCHELAMRARARLRVDVRTLPPTRFNPRKETP
jgi:RNA polymerase sigma-70 factor (ECF subfamily)